MAEDESLEAHEESEEVLHNIALHVYNGNYGSYLKEFADSYLHEDKKNKEILHTAWKQLIEKYDLMKKVEWSLRP